MIIISSFQDGLAIMKSVHGIFRLILGLWILAGITVILSLIFSYWLFLILILLIIIGKYLLRLEKSDWMFLAAILLTVEMIVNDFAGWGSKYKSERAKFIEFFNDISVQNQSFWLDYFLPARN